MTSISIYHYVYRVTNIRNNMHYYGVRSSKIIPLLDLGIHYFSSSTNKTFIKEQKSHPENFRYKIIRSFPTRKSAMSFEIRIHAKLDVGVNPNFYNKAKATSSGFGMSGIKFSEDHRMKIGKSNTNLSIYTFYHKDGTQFTGTQKDFRENFNISQPNVSRLVNGKRKYVDGWSLSLDDAKMISHTFYHKDGTIFIGTQGDFRRKFSLNSGGVNSVVHGKVKSISGWSKNL